MIPAIDAYSFHRYFGLHYPELESDPGWRMTSSQLLDVAERLGVRAISLEHCFYPDFSEATLGPLKDELDDRGFRRVWAWGHPKGLHSGASPAALDDLISHIGVASYLGAEVMRICAGGRGTRPATWAEHKAALLPMLHRASAVAADSGVVLAIENHIDLYADELVELCETIDSPALGVCLDTANNLRLFEHPVDVARKLAPWTRATHVKDIAATRGDPRTFAFWPSVPLGQGAVEIDSILSILRDVDYRGLLALEIDLLHPAFQSEEDALRAGLDYLKLQLERA